MVWGLISNEGPEHLVWINPNGERQNADNYISMLSDDYILETIK
jgi:hypothetical protein